MTRWFRRLLIARAIRRALRDGAREEIRQERAEDEAPQLTWNGAPVRSISYVDITQADDGSMVITGRGAPEAPAASDTKLPPGRQKVTVNRGDNGFSFFGRASLDPFEIPDNARSVKWEQKHLFSPYGKLPERTVFGLQCSEPPLAMVCPECDMKQPALQHGQRTCGYCGTQILVHGTRLYWWQPTEEPSVWPKGIARP